MCHLLSVRSSGNSGIRLICQHSGKAPVAQAEPQRLRLTSSNKIGCPFSVNIRPSKKDGGLWRVCRDTKGELTCCLRHECEPNPLLIMGIPTNVLQLSAEILASIESLHRSGIGAAHICAHLMREFDLEYLPDRVIHTATQRFDETSVEAQCQTAKLIETLRKSSSSMYLAITWLGCDIATTSASSPASSEHCVPVMKLSAPS